MIPDTDKVYYWAKIAMSALVVFALLIFACEKIDHVRIIKIQSGTVSNTSYTSSSVEGKVIDIGSNGIENHGHCWSTADNPTTSQFKTELGSKETPGTFQSNLEDLTANTKYYVRAYALDKNGKEYYGDLISFTTQASAKPTVTTSQPKVIDNHTAECGGNITDNGGSQVTVCGLCWDIVPSPTTDNEYTVIDTVRIDTFTDTLTGLTENTQYYVRAYATNSAGTSYGETVSFTIIPANIEWEKSFGGSDAEFSRSIIQTSDGGYVVAGYSYSNDGDVTGNHGSADYWIIKLDQNRTVEWKKSYGGTNEDFATSIIQTSDGGYLVGGYVYSNDGNVSGNHGARDYWIVKLDEMGVIDWQKCFGGTASEFLQSIAQTSDGGYILAGSTFSNDGDVTGYNGQGDYWIVKLNQSGVMEWQKCLGGNDEDNAYSIVQTSDGGYAVAGLSRSTDLGTTANHGGRDYLIIKLNQSGVMEWQKCYGGSDDDYAQSIIQTSDGGYVIAGNTYSNDGDVSGYNGNRDYWIVKLNHSGLISWIKCFGGTDLDHAYSIIESSEGGYVIAGSTRSGDGDVIGNHNPGEVDIWVIMLDQNGTAEWKMCFGGSNGDDGNSIIQNSDGNYVISGSSLSNDGDVSVNHGDGDYWIISLQSNLK